MLIVRILRVYTNRFYFTTYKWVGLLLILAVPGCKKDHDKPPCYACKLYIPPETPGTRGTQDVCTDRVDTVQFIDQNGQLLQADCHKK